MIDIEQFKDKIAGLNVVKTFPASGQKQVYLISTNDYGTVILKIIKNMDERIAREIDIVTKNNISDVPKIILLDSIDIDSEKYFYILEEYIDGENLKEILKRGSLPLNDCLKLLESLLFVVLVSNCINK